MSLKNYADLKIVRELGKKVCKFEESMRNLKEFKILKKVPEF